MFVIVTLGSVVLFRKVIQPLLFVNSYQRDEVSKIFEMKSGADCGLFREAILQRYFCRFVQRYFEFEKSWYFRMDIGSQYSCNRVQSFLCL